MELHELKHLARRLRAVLQEEGTSISHGQALELVSAVPGLRGWSEVMAFPHRLTEAVLSEEAISRLKQRIQVKYSTVLGGDATLFAALTAETTLPSQTAAKLISRVKPAALPTDLYTADMPSIFARFSEQIGESHWLRREKGIKDEVRGASYLKDYLLEENSIALALAHCSAMTRRFGRIPSESVNDRSLYPAFRVAAQVLSLIDSSDAKQARQIVRRLHGAFRNPDEMRAIQFELGIATHFVKRNHSVTWPEMTGAGTFDLLVEDLGPEGLDVECKSVSVDKGRRIHRREALEFLNSLREKLATASQRLRSGLAVVLTLPDRLPPDFKGRKELCLATARAVIGGKSGLLIDGIDLRIFDFDINLFPELGPEITPEVRASVDKITGTNNREVMILGRQGGGALVLVLQCAKEDSFLRYLFDTVDDAARRQLSKDRPGVVLVGLDGISPDELVETAEQDRDPGQPPTALRVAVSDFLSRTSKNHLVGVAFTSRDSLTPTSDGHVSSGGATYYFPKKESLFWRPQFSGLFNEIELMN